MSKNIRGLTQASLTVSQINFIDALFNTVTAVTINGTTAEITGTLTVNNLVITGTFTLTGGIDVDGVTTTTLKLTNIPQDNTDTTNRNLLFIGAGDQVHQHNTLTFNQSTQELRCQDLLVSQRTYANLLYMAYNVSVSTDETAKIIFKRPTDGLLASTNTFAYNSGLDKLLCGGAEFEGDVKFNSVANPFADGTNREILVLGGSNVLSRDAAFTYNMLNNQLNTPNANISITLTTNDAAVDGDLVVAGTSDFNGVTTINSTLTTNGTAVDGDLTVSGTSDFNDVTTINSTLTVTGSTALGSVVKINALGSVGTQTCRLLSWDDAAAYDSKQIRTSGDLYYNGSTETLHVPNVTGNVTATTTTTDTLNLKAVEPIATGSNCRLCFFDGDSLTGSTYNIVKSGNLYFNPSNSILVTNRMQAQIQMNTPLFVMMVPAALIGLPNSVNASIGLYNHSGTVRSRYQHTGGHLFMDGNTGNNLLMTNTTQTRIYNELQCDDDVNVSGTLTASVLNIGTQTATNFSVTNDLTVGSNTILSNVPTAGGTTALSILLLGTNKIQRGSITFNPLSNILSTTNIGLTGSLSSSIVTTTTLTATTLDLSGDLTLPNLTSPVTNIAYTLLLRDESNDEIIKTDVNRINVSVNSFGNSNHVLQCEDVSAKQYLSNPSYLPINYATVYSCSEWGTDNGTFGGFSSIKINTTGGAGGSPRIFQYGKEVFTSLSPNVKGAINFQSSSSELRIQLSDNSFAGMWKLSANLVYQNTSNLRQCAKISVYKYNGNTTVIEPQCTVGVEYLRPTEGEISTINVGGIVFMEDTTKYLNLITRLDTHTVTYPPLFNDTSTDFEGLEISICMEFLGTIPAINGYKLDAL